MVGRKRPAAKKKKVVNIEWSCPHCGYTVVQPETVKLGALCPECGNKWNVSGVEVESKDAAKVVREMDKRAKKEVEEEDEDY